MELEFKKYSNNRYNLESNSGYILTHIQGLMAELSIGVKVNKFASTMNDTLFEQMLSRYIASAFIKQYPAEVKDEHHVLITLAINNKSYQITVGNFNLSEEIGYINGITEIK